MPLVIIAALDWAVAGGVLYAALPSGDSFTIFLDIFLIAQVAGIISQVPAGLGVFDAVMLLLLARHFPACCIFASLIVYRIVYYIVPLLPMLVMLAVEEATD